MGQAASYAKLEERYFLQKVKLGQGSFGIVWRAVDRRTDEVVAIKQMDKSKMPRRGVNREDVEREITMMKACVHDNITRLNGTFEDNDNIYLALEYCDGGDFGDKIKERASSLKEDEVQDWMVQVLFAVEALHAQDICHRDIKPDNFMVSKGRLKLSDFGLAFPLPRGKLLTQKCGTPAFMAPEQHLLPKASKGYSHPVDMWAAGCIMYMLLCNNRHPFLTTYPPRGNLEEARLVKGEISFAKESSGFLAGLMGAKEDDRFSEAARALCRRLLHTNTRGRLTAQGALQDPWLARAAGRRPQQDRPRANSVEPKAAEGYPAKEGVQRRNSAEAAVPATPAAAGAKTGAEAGPSRMAAAAAERLSVAGKAASEAAAVAVAAGQAAGVVAVGAVAAAPRALQDAFVEVKDAIVTPNPTKGTDGRLGNRDAPARGSKNSSNGDLKADLSNMGFTPEQIAQASARCSSREAAVEWILANN